MHHIAAHRPTPGVALLVVSALVASLLAPGLDRPARGAGDPADRGAMGTILSDNPANHTPNVVGADKTLYVSGLAEVGDTVVAGGRFDFVNNPGQTTNIARFNIFAYDAATGVVDTGFAPAVNGTIDAVAAHPDGQSVFITGNFSTVNGEPSYGLARLDIATGQRVAGFATTTEGRVRDAVVRGSTLYLGGDFWRVGGLSRNGLAAVNVDTGAVLGLNVPVSDPRSGGTTWVASIDVSVDQDYLVAAGNFLTVGGQTREQIALIDLSVSGGAVHDWQARDYEDDCNLNAFWTYMRDVEFSPDGLYLVVATTGGPYVGQICDTAARFEMADRGEVQYTWANWSGGDTLTALAVTDGAIYVGGHQRWLNNHLGRDNAKIGAVSRDGLGALDPVNGVPLNWNPGRDRGATVHTLTVTKDGTGLLMGHDTKIVAGENRWKIALFPAGAATVPAPVPVDLPVGLVQTQTDGSLTEAVYDGSAVWPREPIDSGVDWSATRGITLEGDDVFYVDTAGNLYTRTVDGSVFGPEQDLTTGVYAGTTSTDTPRLTSNQALTFDAGRLLFASTANSSLRYRWMSLESGILGSETFTVSTPGLTWSTTTAMEVVGEHLYRTRSDGGGLLYRINLIDGVPTGTETAVSGPGIDDRDWSGRDFWARPVVPPPSVSLTAPEDGATLSGVVTFDAAASPGVTSVDFFVDGSVIGSDTDGADGWTLDWDTTAVGNNTYMLTAVAFAGDESAGSAPVTVTVSNPTSAEVLLVVGNAADYDADDSAVRDRLDTNGYDVVIVDDNDADAADAEGKAFVLLAVSTNSSVVGTKFNGVATPVLVAKPYLFGTLGLTASGSANYGSQTASTISIVDPSHPLAAGLSGAVAFRPVTTRFSWGNPAADAAVVAEVNGDPTIFTIAAGNVLADGTIAPGCRMTFPLFTNNVRHYVGDAWTMFDAAAAWATGKCQGLAGPPVDQPPTVTITAPVDGATVGAVTTITADAADDDAVISVQFTLDSASLGTDTDGSDGWSINWDTTATGDGPHLIGAIATDTADQTTAAAEVAVTVDNGGGVADPTVLLVVGNPGSMTPDDLAIRDRLAGAGYVVEVVDDGVAQAGDAVGTTFVLIANSVGSVLGATFVDATVPVWNAKPYLFAPLGMTGPVDGVDQGSEVSTVVTIVDPAHPLSAGLSGEVALKTPSGRYSWGIPANEATVVAEVNDKPTIFTYPTGATLFDGSVAAGCRMTFPLFAGTVRWYTTTGWQLFDAAVDWAAGGCD